MEVKPDQRTDGLDKAKDLTGDLGKQLSHSIYSPFSRILTDVFLHFSILTAGEILLWCIAGCSDIPCPSVNCIQLNFTFIYL